MTRIAINGFGRIGRGILRVLLERDSNLDVVAVNDLEPIETLAHLLNADSVYGPLIPRVAVEGSELVAGERRISVFAEQNPADLPWEELGIDTVLEVTGRFTAADLARAHLDAGAGRVIVGAPSKGADATIALGVNDDALNSAKHRIVSIASCTTNALAPLAKVLHDAAGIRQGFMTTVHAYTQDQNLVDGGHRDLRRARAAALNIVPTTTGAARAIGLVLPELDGKLSGDAIRVPTPVGSLVELNCMVDEAVSREELLHAYRSAADGSMRGILEYSEAPLVSTDIVGNPASSIFDAPLTRVDGTLVKVTAWYDNEWAFSNRMVEAAERF